MHPNFFKIRSSGHRLLMVLSSRLFHFFSLSTLIFVVAFLFLPLSFEENDDITMMSLASGAYSGEPSPNLVFINYFWGVLLNSLYGAFPEVSWYSGLMLLALSACWGLAISTAIDRFQRKQPIGIFALTALSTLIFSSIVQMQFTTAAAILATVGAWSFLISPQRVSQGIGAALVLMGFLLRFEMAALVALIGAPLVLLALWRQAASVSRVLWLSALITVSLGLHMTSERIYRDLGPAYVAFNDVRGQLNDNRNAGLLVDAMPEGVSLNDYALLLSFFPDPLEMNQYNLTALHEAVTQNEGRLTLRNWTDVGLRLLKKPQVYLVLVTLLIAAFALPGRVQGGLLIACSFAFFLPLLYFGVFAIAKERILYGAAVSVLGGFFFLNLPGSHGRLTMIAQLALIGLTVFFLKEIKNRIFENLWYETLFREQAEILMAWDGPVYVYPGHLRIEGAQLFTEDLEPFSQKIISSGWMTLHPDNPAYQSHRDLLQEGVALFLSPTRHPDAIITQILLALVENYDVQAEADIVMETEAGLLVTFSAQ